MERPEFGNLTRKQRHGAPLSVCLFICIFACIQGRLIFLIYIVDVKKPSTGTIVTPHTTPTTPTKPTEKKPTTLTDDSDEIGSLMPFMDDEIPEPTLMNIDTPTTFTTTDPAKVSMIAWSSDDRWCFVASNHGEIRVYYAYNGDMACILKGHEGEIYALDNHPLDPSTILSAGYDGKVILWDVEKQKVITCRSHIGRTFTDCKFSKDAMKYAITDEEGHCTLFGIGGLDKDYEQVRSWERGQYFMSDYQALRHFADGSFLDEPTQQPPYALSPSPIIDLQGVAYPNQKKFGYGRTIPTTSETFEIEDMKRSACYDLEEEEIRTTKLIILPAVDRASIAKRRREFVRFEDDDDAEIAAAATQLQFPPPVVPVLLPDDSADEDYHDDDDDEPGNAAYASSASSDEGGSDDFVTRDNNEHLRSEDEVDEEGPVTRSRAGQLGHIPSTRSSRPSTHVRRGTSSTRRRGGRGGGRNSRGNTRGRPAVTSSRSTRKRNRDRSDDDEEEPVRARARRRVAEIPSYMESDLESDEEEVDIDNEADDDDAHSDNSEAGPSRSAPYIETHNNNTYTNNNITSTETVPEDRKGKRKLRSAAAHSSDDDFIVPPEPAYVPPVASSSSSGRATRSRASHQHHEPLPPPPTPVVHIKKPMKHRDGPRELSEDEIKQHEPIPWITTTEKSLTKYLPQMGDYVAVLTEGHKQYLKSSDMKAHFDDKYGILDKHEPVVFGKIVGITWLVGPPAYCKLKLAMMALANVSDVIFHGAPAIWTNLKQSQIIEYSDEDGRPEFIVLWQRFLASMNVFKTLQVGQKVDAIYDEGQYTGTISSCNFNGMYWKGANLPSPWAFYHVIWDDASSTPEDLCPWELVPTGEDFRERYDVEPSLTQGQVKRAKDILTWLSGSDEFYLYVHQVNYYDYPPYLSLIAYPICLDMIQERLDNDFYRSVDVRMMMKENK